MTAKEKLQKEYDSVEAKQVLNDKDFDKFENVSPDRLVQLNDKVRKAYLSTLKWHNFQKMSLSSLEGIVIGNRSIEEL